MNDFSKADPDQFGLEWTGTPPDDSGFDSRESSPFTTASTPPSTAFSRDTLEVPRESSPFTGVSTPESIAFFPEPTAVPQDCTKAPAEEKKAPIKKRKSWGQPLPEPTTNLPPRKRAKTAEEKEQRRVERVLRNRAAAQKSREAKKLEFDRVLEQKKLVEEDNTRLMKALSQTQDENTQLKDENTRLKTIIEMLQQEHRTVEDNPTPTVQEQPTPRSERYLPDFNPNGNYSNGDYADNYPVNGFHVGDSIYNPLSPPPEPTLNPVNLFEADVESPDTENVDTLSAESSEEKDEYPCFSPPTPSVFGDIEVNNDGVVNGAIWPNPDDLDIKAESSEFSKEFERFCNYCDDERSAASA